MSLAAPGGSGRLRAAPGRGRPLGAQPLLRLLELAASKAADVTAFDHPGGATPSANPNPNPLTLTLTLTLTLSLSLTFTRWGDSFRYETDETKAYTMRRTRPNTVLHPLTPHPTATAALSPAKLYSWLGALCQELSVEAGALEPREMCVHVAD